MKKKIVFIITCFSCFFSGVYLSAQTTELAYNLGVSGNPLTISSIATDASDNIFICGTFKGSLVEFNPLGTSVTKNSLSGSQDGFIAKYNSSGILQKVHSFGYTSSIDKAVKLTVDASGNVYLAAVIFGSTNFELGSPTYALGGSGATVLVKYDNSLTFQSLKNIRTASGGSGDEISDLKVDGNGNIYLTGFVTNPDLDFEWVNLAAPSAFAISSNGSSDIFIAKYNAALDCQWAYNIGDTGSDAGNSLDLDNTGNIYLTGTFSGQNVDFSPAAATSNTISEVGGGASSSGDVFVAKYSSAMAYQWAFGFGSGLLDEGTCILVNKATSTIFVAGNLKNDALNVDLDPSASIASFSGVGSGDDLFLASYTSAGAYRWHKGVGGTTDDDVNAITFGNAGAILMTGFFQGSNVDFGNGQVVSSLGAKDVFVAEFSSTGTTTNVFNVGGTGNEQGNAIDYSDAGKVLVSGILSASGDYNPAIATTLTLSPEGPQDGFVVRYLLCTSPGINTHPATQAVCDGTSLNLSVTASSATSYQWKKGGVVISGATSAAYSISNVDPSDAGTYTVDVINSCNTVTSNAAVVTISTCTPVSISVQDTETIRIYPKPTASTSVIEFKNRKGKEALVTILSMTGSIIWSGTFVLTSDLSQFILPINEFPQGQYLVQIQIQNELFTDKLQRIP